jgi:hypothetical protein
VLGLAATIVLLSIVIAARSDAAHHSAAYVLDAVRHARSAIDELSPLFSRRAQRVGELRALASGPRE